VPGYLVELVSGLPFDRCLEQRLFRPLGLVDTRFVVPEADAVRALTIYSLPEEENVMQAVRPEPPVVLPSLWAPLGDSRLISTVADYVRFLQLLHPGG